MHRREYSDPSTAGKRKRLDREHDPRGLEDEPDLKAIDAALVSTRLPEQGALKLTSAITQLAPSTKVLALGLTEEKKHVLRYVEAGATGYVLKDHSREDLIETVRAAQNGKVFVSPQITEKLAVEIGTVKNHVHSILEKLNVKSRQEAAAYLAAPLALSRIYLHLYPLPMTLSMEFSRAECYPWDKWKPEES